MGRLIDETDLMNLLYALYNARHELSYAIKKIPELPPVEAIPKADYETRLKADMIAMLEEISLKFDEQYHVNRHELHDDFLNRGLEQGQNIIQQKINELKDDTDKSTKLYTEDEVIYMLEDLKKEMNPIKECEYQIYGKEHWNFVGKCQDVVQQKINTLKAEREVEDGNND